MEVIKQILCDRYNVSRETIEKLETYQKLLVKWQKALNIVSRGTLEDFWNRHILDSLQIIDKISPNSTVLDVGSGGGFPGMVLAICGNNLRVTCVDSDSKKTIFLEEVARLTQTKVNILVCRVETIDQKFDVMCARGFSSLKNLIDLAYYRSEKCVFLKGKTLDSEIAEAKKNYNFEFNISDSITNNQGKIITIENISKIEA